MESFKEKHIKEQINEALQSSSNSDEKPNETEKKTFSKFLQIASDTALENKVGNKHFKKIQDIFQKTETMKEVAKEKNQQLDQQFKFLKQRLNSSSEYLLRIKKNIENVKFSYQKNVLDMHKALDPGEYLEAQKYSINSKEDMAKHMEDIRRKIENLQCRMAAQREKHECVAQSYQAAFDTVVDTLQQIETGSYSSQNLKVIKD